MAKAREIVGLDCAGPAREAIRLVLRFRMDEMCELREAALNWNDPEGIHDIRVASRRLRGALRDFMPYLRKRGLTRCADEIKTIARALGSVRDLDVAIIELEKTAAKAPAEVAPGIREMIESRMNDRLEARSKVVPAIDQELLSLLQGKFALALDATIAARRQTKTAKERPGVETYRDVGRITILRRLGDFEKQTESLYQPLRVKPLHQFRIAAKHLRYAIELFGSCWDQAAMSSWAKRIADMQSSLGRVHDCDVWIESIGERATSNGPRAIGESRITAVWLVSHFLKLRTRQMALALEQWNDWEKEQCSARLREAIKAEPPIPE